MPSLLIPLAALVAAGVAWRARPSVVLGVVVGTVLLVPAGTVLPNGISSLPTVPRLVVLAALAGLVVRVRRGEAPAAIFRPTPVTVALLAFLAVALVDGVAQADRAIPVATQLGSLFVVVDQVVLFVVALALLRLTGAWCGARVVAGCLLAFAAVAALEHVTGSSWGAFLLRHTSQARSYSAAAPLELRAGRTRVRSGAQYALDYGWMVAALLPMLAVAASRARHRVRTFALVAATGLVAMTVVWSYSRSAIAGLVAGPLVAWLASGLDRRLGRLVLAGLTVGLAVYLVLPDVSTPLAASVDSGTIDVRLDRIPVAFDAVGRDRLTGVGFNGLDELGVLAADNGALLVYAELGAIGAAVVLLLFATTILGAVRGVRGAPDGDRPVAAAALAGVVVTAGALFSFDLLSIAQPAQVLWLLAALATASAPALAGAPAVRWPPSPRWAIVPVAALAVGIAMFALAPRPASAQRVVETVTAAHSAGPGTDLLLGRTLAATACQVATRAGAEADLDVRCRTWPGDGAFLLRVAGPSPAALDRLPPVLEAMRAAVPSATVTPLGGIDRRPPAWAGTAPVWCPLLALGALLLLPARPRRSGQDPDASGVRSLALAG
jgi:hypothetical protein